MLKGEQEKDFPDIKLNSSDKHVFACVSEKFKSG